MNADIKALSEEIQQCRKCPLHREIVNQRTSSAYGKLTLNHKLRVDNNFKVLFVGLNPSIKRFDSSLLAFEGRTTGDFLDEALKSSNLQDVNIFITNLLKCSTPYNRVPLDEEVVACKYWLEKEIDLIKPTVIVAMGVFVRESFAKFFDRKSFKYLKMKHPSYYFRLNNLSGLVNELNSIWKEISNRKNLCDYARK